MSPGEYARKGDGLRIYWGWFDSPFGLALVMGTAKGAVYFLKCAGKTSTPSRESSLAPKNSTSEVADGWKKC
jgi:hypothetical protein